MVGVSHLEGHLAALSLADSPPPHPFLALLVSGGHTSLFLVHGPGQQEELGSTVDDAAGEAFDKVAKLYGLGYPGGVIIDRMAASGDPKAIQLPRPRLHDGTLDFSFSGLKSAVVRFREANQGQDYRIEDLCAGFQEAVVEVLVKKTLAAARERGVGHLALAGGVAANQRLRRAMAEAAGPGRPGGDPAAHLAVHRQRGHDRRGRLPPPARRPTSVPWDRRRHQPPAPGRGPAARAPGVSHPAAILKAHGLQAGKKRGQNFLTQPATAQAIAAKREHRARGHGGGDRSGPGRPDPGPGRSGPPGSSPWRWTGESMRPSPASWPRPRPTMWRPAWPTPWRRIGRPWRPRRAGPWWWWATCPTASPAPLLFNLLARPRGLEERHPDAAKGAGPPFG